jgi:predicted HicB family RNase H-like nuclease
MVGAQGTIVDKDPNHPMPEEEKKQFVTSLRVDSDLWKEAKVQAIRHDMTLTELVEEAINLWMKEKMTENGKQQKK